MKKLFLSIAILLSASLYAVDITVSETASNIGKANSWKNGQAYYSFTLNDRVTFAVKQSAEGKQNGYFWNDQTPADWRIYQARNQGEFSVSVPTGYVIRTLVLEYHTTKQGVLSRVAGQQIAKENQIASGEEIRVESSSITLYAANLMDSAAGQVRLTRFTVTYSYTDTTSLIEGFSRVEQTQNNETENTWEGDICHWNALRVRRASKDTLNGGIQATWFNQNGYLQSVNMEGGIKHLRFNWREFVTTVEDLKLEVSTGDHWKDTVVMTSSGSFPTSRDWYYDQDIQWKENGQLKLMNISDTATRRYLIGDLFITPYIYVTPELRSLRHNTTEGDLDLRTLLLDNTEGEGEIVYTILSDATDSTRLRGSVLDFSTATTSGEVRVQISWNNGRVTLSPITIYLIVKDTSESFVETFSSCTQTALAGTTYVKDDRGFFGWNFSHFSRTETDTIMGVQGTRIYHGGSVGMNGAQEGGIMQVAFAWRAVNQARPVHFIVRVDGEPNDVNMSIEQSKGEIQTYMKSFGIIANTALAVEVGAKEKTEQSEIILGHVAITPYLLFRSKLDTLHLNEATMYNLDSAIINNTHKEAAYTILSDETGVASITDGKLDLSAATANGKVNVQATWGQVTTSMTLYAQVDATSLVDRFTDSPIHRFTKVIKNGQLIIIRGNQAYNAQGSRL